MLSEIDQSVFSAYDKSVYYAVPNKWGKTGCDFCGIGKGTKDYA